MKKRLFLMISSEERISTNTHHLCLSTLGNRSIRNSNSSKLILSSIHSSTRFQTVFRFLKSANILQEDTIAGNKRTSLILFESVKNIVSRSIPIPQPPSHQLNILERRKRPVGGNPYSKAVQKFSSMI